MRCLKRNILPRLDVTSAGVAKNGNPITSVNTNNSATTHEDSGDFGSFSPDSDWLTIYDDRGTTGSGVFYAINVNTGQQVHIGTREQNSGSVGAVNNNLVWSNSGNQFWWLESGVLQLRDIFGNIHCQTPLPATLPGPNNGPNIQIAWAAELSAHENQLVLSIFGAGQNGFVVVTHSGSSCTLGPPVWISDAYDAGFSAGTVITDTGLAIPNPRRLHNIEFFNGGVFGGLTSDNAGTQHIYHWVPLDGSTMVQLSPDTQPGLANEWSHPVGDGSSIYVGQNAQAEIHVYEFSQPPVIGDKDQSPVCFIDKALLEPHFNVLPATDPIAWQHGQVQNGKLVFTAIHQGDSTQAIFVADAFSGSCPSGGLSPTCVRNNLAPATAFLEHPRPTISPNGQHVAWQEVVNGRICVRFVEV